MSQHCHTSYQGRGELAQNIGYVRSWNPEVWLCQPDAASRLRVQTTQGQIYLRLNAKERKRVYLLHKENTGRRASERDGEARHTAPPVKKKAGSGTECGDTAAPTHPVTESPAHPEDVGKWKSRAFKRCCVDFGGHTRVTRSGTMKKPGIRGRRESRGQGSMTTATLPVSYHHSDCNMTRRWKYD